MPKLNERPLKVVPNPFAHLDHNGYPAAAFPYDFEFSAGRRLYVGAELDKDAAKVIERRAEGDPRAPTRETNRWRFHLEPVEIEDTAHHRLGIKDGSLIPADERTHRSVLGAAKYVPWKDVIANALVKAADGWAAEHYGEKPAFVDDEQWAVVGRSKGEKKTKEEVK